MDHTLMHRRTHTRTGVQMGRVLLLNNAYYVDAIKDTWAESRAPFRHCGQLCEGSFRASLVQIWSCHEMYSV